MLNPNQNSQDKTLFAALLIFFGFLCFVISAVIGLAGLLGRDLGLLFHSDTPGLHGYLALVVGLMGLALALACNCFLITKFSIWIEKFFKSVIFRNSENDSRNGSSRD